MNNLISLFLMLIVCFLSSRPVFSDERPQALSAMTLYRQGDYKGTAELLEQQVRSKEISSGKIDHPAEQALYRERLFLAYLLAWRLNKTDQALEELAKAGTLREKNVELNKFPPVDLLYSCDILDGTGDLRKAAECYERFLSVSGTLLEKEHDDFSIIMLDEYIKLAKYQLDGIRLRGQPQDRSTMLLKRIKLSSQAFPAAMPMMVAIASPVPLSIDARPDLVAIINNSSNDIGSMIMNYALVVGASASEVTDASEKAFRAYLNIYPESYYSLVLRYQFMKYYRENGFKKKADKLEQELVSIGRKRHVEILVAPEKRFASPEETWQSYRKALIRGDIEEAMECYMPGQRKHRQVFEHLGQEKSREIAERMGDISRVTSSRDRAKYRIRRMENGREITYYIEFVNMNGEWKMLHF